MLILRSSIFFMVSNKIFDINVLESRNHKIAESTESDRYYTQITISFSIKFYLDDQSIKSCHLAELLNVFFLKGLIKKLDYFSV